MCIELYGSKLVTLTLSFVLILLLQMPAATPKHPCISECGKFYSKASRLSDHQKQCHYILRNRQRLHEIRKSQKGKQPEHATASSNRGGESSQLVEQPPTFEHVTGDSFNVNQLTEPLLSNAQEIRDPIHIESPTELPLSHLPNENENISGPLTTASGRPRCNHRLPRRFEDILPVPPTGPVADCAQTSVNPAESAPSRRVTLVVWEYLRTAVNRFGLCDLSNTHSSYRNAQRMPSTYNQLSEEAPGSDKPSFWPFPNKSIQLFMSWLNDGNTTKSKSEADRLVRNCILSPDFNPRDMVGFSAHRENRRMDREGAKSDLRSWFMESSVNIQVPTASPAPDPPIFSIPGLLHRDLTEVIRNAFSDHLAHLLHYSPFKLFHKSSSDSSQSQHIYGEVYSSDAFIEEYKHVQRHGELPPDDPHCKREKSVAALMFLSDATQLTDFGNAKAWPIYLMLGNLSKYVRSDVSSGAMHHLAYIPSLPESFKAFASRLYSGSWRSQESNVMAHCRRELMHAVWHSLLDEKFLHAYRYGIVIRCIDGVERRIYPRIFSYSADYPEKALLATIRDKGLFPCPRCLVHRSELHNLGQRRDRKTRMEKLRVGVSAVPTVNAFVDRLGTTFNPSKMLTVDLLHEVELGTWKMLFSHLVRILHASSDRLVTELNERFKLVPMFGNSGAGIRRFPPNVSEMKRMAARDFEDLLQCALPCFEGLLPLPHNRRLMKLLYRFAEWHALAKLRMHSDETLDLLAELTTEVGHLLQHFRKDTASDLESCRRQDSQGSSSTQPAHENVQKPLNLSTIKCHFMGDYEDHIRRFGTTDSYSTQLGEQSHCVVKRLYGMTNKKNATRQIGAKYLQQQVFRAQEDQERREAQKPEYLDKHHIISHSTDEPVNLFEFVRDNAADPAKKGFISKLKDHILGRLMNRKFDGDMHDEFTSADRNSIRIRNNHIFRHHTIHVNYTTYDIRRDYDTVNPRNRPFCMIASPDTATDPNAHPFWYAAVIGVFHAEVQHTGAGSQDFTWKTVEFLWVRWLGIEPDYSSGRRLAKLPKFGFVPDSDDYAFSFLDPAEVIRGCHLIPAFIEGRTSELMPYSGLTEARATGEEDDWTNYYVNIFVDRNMYLRHIGLGIGHQPGTAAGPGTCNSAIHNDVDAEDGDIGISYDNDDDEVMENEAYCDTESDEEASEPEGADQLEEEDEDEGLSDGSNDLGYDDL
uniref:C2H2-type domain-containing protein n=1 Tax=Leucocoprinus birnbaumii TaxID=56174 RepID=A0AAD5VJF2_9AGAR